MTCADAHQIVFSVARSVRTSRKPGSGGVRAAAHWVAGGGLQHPYEERQLTIMKQFEKLKTSVKRKVEELCDNQPDGDENQKIVRIFKGNSIQSWYLVEDNTYE